MSRIKSPEPNKGAKVATHEEIVVPHHKHPIFCFRHLHKDYSLECCTQEEKISFIDRLCKLGKMDWQDIQLSPKHGMGSEKIARYAIKPGIPNEISGDVDHFLAFRFHGKAPFVGFRNKFIFHIVYIDAKFSVYAH